MNIKTRKIHEEESKINYKTVHEYEHKSLHGEKCQTIFSSTINEPSNDLRKFASKTYLKKMKNQRFSKMTGLITLKNIPKRFLKKCKLCCFKKRSCFLCPSLCTALNKNCFNCGIQGHFPKSKMCFGMKQECIRIPQYDGGEDESESKKKDNKGKQEVFTVDH